MIPHATLFVVHGFSRWDFCHFTIRCLFLLIISKSAAVKATTITMSLCHNETEGDIFCNTGLTSHYTAPSPILPQALEMHCCTSTSSQNGCPRSASGFKWLNILNYVSDQFNQHSLWSSVCHYKVTLNQYSNTYILKLQLQIMYIYSNAMPFNCSATTQVVIHLLRLCTILWLSPVPENDEKYCTPLNCRVISQNRGLWMHFWRFHMTKYGKHTGKYHTCTALYTWHHIKDVWKPLPATRNVPLTWQL